MTTGVWGDIARIRTPLNPRSTPVTVLSKISKAVAAAVASATGAYVVANQVGGVSPEEWGGIVGTLLFTAFITYFAPRNTTPA